MKKITLIVMISLSLLFGCTKNDELVNEKERLQQQLNPGTKENVDPEFDKRLGYVNYKKEQIAEDEQAQLTIDRYALADMVTRMLLKNDSFSEVATLVTGNEVLIAYEKDKENNHSMADTKTFAKKTAMSMLPRYYDIYVSDNPRFIDDLHSLRNQTTDSNQYQKTIDTIIKEMKEKP